MDLHEVRQLREEALMKMAEFDKMAEMIHACCNELDRIVDMTFEVEDKMLNL